VKAVRESEGVTYPPGHDRRHTINIVMQAPGPLHAELDARWGFGSPLPYTAIIGQWDHRTYSPADNTFGGSRIEAIGGAFNGARYPNYSRLDVGLHWKKHKWGMLLEPYVEVVNLYDRRNVFTYFIDEQRASTTTTAIYQLPFLASFGVEFSW
jgi:hypothetical protein